MSLISRTPAPDGRRRRLRAVAVPALAAALAATTLAGCGGSGRGSDSDTVTMWTYPVIFDEAKNKAYWDGLVKAFEKQHTGIKVKVETFPWANRDTALATAIASGKGPDVVYLVPDQLPKYARNIVPAEEYMSQSARADYTDFALTSVTADGKTLGTPVLTSGNPLICDKRVFTAIGEQQYPGTWEDLARLAPRLKEKGYYATSYSGDTQQTLNLTFYPLLWQAGGDVFGKDGKKTAFADAAGVKALTYLKKLVDGGYTDRDMVTTTPKLEQTPSPGARSPAPGRTPPPTSNPSGARRTPSCCRRSRTSSRSATGPWARCPCSRAATRRRPASGSTSWPSRRTRRAWRRRPATSRPAAPRRTCTRVTRSRARCPGRCRAWPPARWRPSPAR